MAIVETSIAACGLDGSAELRIRYDDTTGAISALVLVADMRRQIEIFARNDTTSIETKAAFNRRTQGDFSLVALGLSMVQRNGRWSLPKPYTVGMICHDPALR